MKGNNNVRTNLLIFHFMKSIRYFFTVICCMSFGLMNAQTTYKGVTIDRDRNDVTCVVITNSNCYPVDIKFQYKIGSKTEAWRDFSYDYLFLEAHEKKILSVGSKIFGLNLIYVDILKPSVGDQILNFFSVSNSSNSSNTGSYNDNGSGNYSGNNSSNTNITGLKCYQCGGTGSLNGGTCPECGGSGKQTKPVPFPEPEKK